MIAKIMNAHIMVLCGFSISTSAIVVLNFKKSNFKQKKNKLLTEFLVAAEKLDVRRKYNLFIAKIFKKCRLMCQN